MFFTFSPLNYSEGISPSAIFPTVPMNGGADFIQNLYRHFPYTKGMKKIIIFCVRKFFYLRFNFV